MFMHDESCVLPPGAKLPDMLTVVPQQLGLQNVQQREILRFSNGIANLGPGPWWMQAALDGEYDPNTNRPAYQVFSDRAYIPQDAVPPASSVDGYLGLCEVGEFEFHPDHNHWHIAAVADYRVCSKHSFETALAKGKPPGECDAISPPAEKVTFCLIDWAKLGDNTAVSDDTHAFWDCYTAFQGITPGWVDQYHHSLPDQGVDITGVDDGTYYLVSTANPDDTFFEEDEDNNSSWVQFTLGHAGNGNGEGNGDGNGNRKVTIVDHACDEKPFRDRVEADVDEYIASSGTPIPRQDLIDGVCNGLGTNK
jgi:hypothetical protein